MPGINPTTYLTDLASAVADLLANTAAAPAIESEPPLACYVTASCVTGAQPATSKKTKCKKRKRKHRHHAQSSKHKRKHCKKKKRHRHR
jgi:hypothetical protein